MRAVDKVEGGTARVDVGPYHACRRQSGRGQG